MPVNQFQLFAHGEAFDVDAFLETAPLRPDFVWRRGDQREYACVESHHITSGVKFYIGDGLSIPFLKQEGIAINYLMAHRASLRVLADFPGVETFVLGLQYVAEFEDDVTGFCLGPSASLMKLCVEIGCEPTYYVELTRS